MSQDVIAVPKGWELTTLFDITISHDGKRTPLNKSQRSQIQGKYPYYGASGQVDSINDYKLDGKFILLAEDGENLNSRKKPIAFIVEGKFWVNNHAHVLEPTEKILIDYLCYYINGLNIMKFAKKQSTRPKLNKTDMNEIPILLPSLQIQKQIVAKLDHILGELDTKKKEILSLIEQNKERIDFFEKNWMLYVIDREIEKHPKREEWSILTLIDVASPEKNSIVDGPFGSNLLKSDYVSNGNYPVLTIRLLYNISQIESANRISTKKFEQLKRSKIEGGDILIAKIGSTYGLTCIYPENYPIAIIPANMCKITPNQNIIETNFLKHWLDSKSFKSLLDNITKKTAQPAFGITNFKQLPIPVPPLSTQKQIIQKIKNAEEKFQLQKKQFENIKQNYDSKINYINHIQSSILDSAFSGKLLN